MRADVYLTANGHASSRSQAKELIANGSVTVDGRLLKKPSEEISEEDHTVEISRRLPYVGRGGLKLEGALDAFGINVENMTNKSKKDYAYTMVDVNSRITDDVADELRAIPGLIRVRVLNH